MSKVPVTPHSSRGTVHECVSTPSSSWTPVTGLTAEHVPVPVAVTSAYVHDPAVQLGFTNVFVKLEPQTNEFGKSIPEKPSARQAFCQLPPGGTV